MPDHKKQSVKIQNCSGFTLIEVAISIIVFSLLLAFGISAAKTYVTLDRERTTIKRMERVSNALTIYAQRQMRLPCPADPANTAGVGEPYGAERGSGAAGTATGNCLGGGDDRRVGIVPFVTLGIPEVVTRDGWGNLLTYSVSPAATLDPLTTNYDNYEIADWCRYQPVWHDGTSHLNPAKAAFCCGTWHPQTQPSEDIVIQGPNGILQAGTRTAVNSGGAAVEYAPVTSPPPDRSDLEETFVPVYTGYILISHGENGLYANTVAELENLDNNDLEFYVTDRVSPVNGGTINLKRPDIDDIVFWRNTTQLMGQLGGESCIRP